MATFPRTEPEVVTLAQTMVSGLSGEGGGGPFPAPPVPVAELVEGMKSDIRHAENAVNGNDEALKLSGKWKATEVFRLVLGVLRKR